MRCVSKCKMITVNLWKPLEMQNKCMSWAIEVFETWYVPHTPFAGELSREHIRLG